ncbi:hypothetical protein GTP45_05145 [Pseudoduganella sp. FT55W]|uniref:Uncharacterized protein n=1 Tax=Duganella rivi TaxID=2666083 RepID=A0A7X4GMG8_9BURK|nr:hypothetical protein [Duganella rivi]
MASTITIDFTKGIDGWVAGVADYTDDSEPTETGAGWSKIPLPVGGMGYYVASRNNSDDVFTFIKRQFTGLVPNAKYTVTFEMTYATDAAVGCFMGVGGARGENVYMVAAATDAEPKVVKQTTDNRYRLNFDHGDQAVSGKQGKVLGVQGVEGLECEVAPMTKATRKSDEAISFTADKDGKFWIVLGTDSAFEGTNALYYLGAVAKVKPQ